MFWRKVDKVICSIHSLTNWNWLLTKSWSLSVSFDSDSISFFRFTCNSILNSIWAIFFEVCRILWVQQTSNESCEVQYWTLYNFNPDRITKQINFWVCLKVTNKTVKSEQSCLKQLRSNYRIEPEWCFKCAVFSRYSDRWCLLQPSAIIWKVSDSAIWSNTSWKLPSCWSFGQYYRTVLEQAR